MKRLCLISVLLLTISITVFSQTFRLEVNDEPLNKVLNRLGMEISFDDKALSKYSVTVSRSFGNPEKALSWLLEDKPFRIEKIGTVYVIVPHVVQQQEEAGVVLRKTEKERFVCKGTVVSQATDEPLEYATVSLLDERDQLLTTGITTGNGQFVIQSSRSPKKVKISYLGYETLLRDIDAPTGTPELFALNETVITLGETVITSDRRPEINRSTYTVSPQMRHGVDNALELLNNIPGTYFDRSSNTVLLNNRSNILLLVDGIQHSHAYLSHLSPDRVHAVEVVYALSGRFVSDDYAGIIHFILKKDYTGYDIHVLSAASFNLSKTGATNRLSENRPSVGIIYTTRKLNFFGMYEYNRETLHANSSKYLTYGASDLAFIPPAHHNNLNNNENHMLTGGLNYHIKPLQLVGIQVDYTTENTHELHEYALQSYDRNRIYNIKENRVKAYASTGALFYQGQVSNRLHLYGDFSYNYYYNEVENEYRHTATSNYHPTDIWDEYKNRTALNLEGKYRFSDRMTLEAGYANIWRQYASQSSQGRGFFDYSEHRNKIFTYLTRYLWDKGGLKFGIALEHVGQRNGEKQTVYLRTYPYLRMNYKINETLNITSGYAAGQSYPALYQLSPISSVIDTFLTQIGNPILKSAVRHQVFAEFSLWNRLKITPQLQYVGDGIGEIYNIEAYKLYRTFDNINFREYSLHTSYDQKLGKYFKLKNTVMLYRSEALHSGIHNALNGWTIHSEADYYHERPSAGIQLGYYRNMKKNILWQGYHMSDRDYWCVTARKELWDNRISVQLSYIPPLAFGVRYDRVKEVNTPQYKEKSTLNLESYNQMLLLKISIRFERGSIKPTESRTDRRIGEREK